MLQSDNHKKKKENRAATPNDMWAMLIHKAEFMFRDYLLKKEEWENADYAGGCYCNSSMIRGSGTFFFHGVDLNADSKREKQIRNNSNSKISKLQVRVFAGMLKILSHLK